MPMVQTRRLLFYRRYWQSSQEIYNAKSARRRRKHCALAVVRRSQKKFVPPQTPFPGAQDGQNLISWRWSLPLPINLVYFSEDRFTQFRVIRLMQSADTFRRHLKTFFLNFTRPFYHDIVRRPCCAPALTSP